MGQPLYTAFPQCYRYHTEPPPISTLLKDYGQFIELYYRNKHNKCKYFITLYISEDKQTFALGNIIDNNIFQATTTKLIYSECRKGYCLSGRHLKTESIIHLKFHADDIIEYKLVNSYSKYELHLH